MNNLSMVVCFCTYNRCDRLTKLVRELRALTSDIPFEILVVNNNSSDQTEQILQSLSREPGVPLRFVTEEKQGISHARNRAVEECIDKNFMLFMDDDELPGAQLLASAIDALVNQQADCVGGKVEVFFGEEKRPKWLSDSLMGFLAEINYGEQPFWISDNSKPLWTANIAYNMNIFRGNPELRFDLNYNRIGDGVGGGEDVIMFRELLARHCKILYHPGMVVHHHIDSWKIKPSYFLKLHFSSGFKAGRFKLDPYPRTIAGIPLFLFTQFLQHAYKCLMMMAKRDTETVRQGMNTTYALGLIWGSFVKWKTSKQNPEATGQS